jgi:hypothetical protein
MKHPVPTFAQCEPTIRREARYWARACRGLFDRDDLAQEARVVMLRVLDTYDPNRAVKIQTVLALSIRRHFRRLTRRALTRAFLTDPARRQQLVVDLHDRQQTSPLGAITARVLLARIAALSPAERALASVLAQEDGRLVRVAERYRWTLYQTRRRVQLLRAAILKEGGC